MLPEFILHLYSVPLFLFSLRTVLLSVLGITFMPAHLFPIITGYIFKQFRQTGNILLVQMYLLHS